VLIAVASLAFGLYSGLANMKRNHKEDSKRDASEMATIIVKLENISIGISEIKTEFNGMKSEVKELRDKVIVNEHSLNAAWKQINSMLENS
jgi:predicted  nucleic acid-binding Zn-ribbon protein